MLHFESDYIQTCHPAILERLAAISTQQYQGYGTDEITKMASSSIMKACNCRGGKVFFLQGGTQANMVTIDALLQSQQGVLCATSAHIATHEAGAIESLGHKVITLKEHQGKIDVQEARQWLENFYSDANCTHMVSPGVLYISHPTEYGTLYTKAQLEDLDVLCEQFGMKLYMDGARLGYALCANATDVTLPDIAEHCTAFCIGGTKCGAMFGEAVVFTRNGLCPYFSTLQKRHGALLAKGWTVSVQFDTLFSGDLYTKISKQGNDAATLFATALKEKGYEFFVPPSTNQLFLMMENEKLESIEKNVGLCHFAVYDNTHTLVRLATSWATKMQDVSEAIKYF